MFKETGGHDYERWCGEQLMESVTDDCRGLATTEARRQCAENIAGEYGSSFFRSGPAKCAALKPGNAATECVQEAMGDLNKVMSSLFEVWEKVRVSGDRDAEVVKAWDATISCLEGKGFKDIDPSLLFPWQQFDSPSEYRQKEDSLTGPDKDLRQRLREPSRECAKREGLFTAQDTAWTVELRRLRDEEPDFVDPIIREGMLETLEKPGVAYFLSGDSPDGAR